MSPRDSQPPAEPSRAVARLHVASSVARVNNGPAATSNDAERAQRAKEDRALVERAKAGDQEAFRALVTRHQQSAFSVALRFVRDEDDAREIVQDAFLRAYRSLGSFEGDSSFFTWLYRIIRNLSIDLQRKPGRDTEELDEARMDAQDDGTMAFPLLSRVDGSDPADVVRRTEIAARLSAALEALPPYHRGVIVMREVDGLSYEEMAQAMGVSKGTIMSRLFHARQKLQRALVDCYEEQVGAVRADKPETRSDTETDTTEDKP